MKLSGIVRGGGRVGLVFLAWGLLAAVAMGNSLLSQATAACENGSTLDVLPLVAVNGLPPYLFWALVTPLILLLVGRMPLERFREPKVAGLHLVAIAGIVAASAAFKAVAHNLLVHTGGFAPVRSWHLDLATYRDTLHAGLPLDVFTYGAILAVGSAWRYYRSAQKRRTESAELQASLAEARYSSLRAKVEPHFLFNTLNTISALAESDPAATRETVASLSTLLRRALDHGATRETELEQELSFCRHYLEIERRRYGTRLHVDFVVGRDVRDLLVPSFLLQPLVENAIRHGTGRRRGASEIRVEASRRDGRLILHVRDDGPGLAGELVEGIGLQSTRARLEELYGEAATMRAGNADGAGFEVRIELPAREAAERRERAARTTDAPEPATGGEALAEA